MTPPCSLVLLAGERGGTDPLADHHGVVSKVLVPVGAEPLILRVIRTLGGVEFRERVLVGPHHATLTAAPALRHAIDAGGWRWFAPGPSPAMSVVSALDALEDHTGVLVTTADHALLSAALVEEFTAAAVATGADLAIGFVRYKDVMAAFPEGRRTGWAFADGRYCSCNLFFFAAPPARAVANLWRQVEVDRKRPWRIVRLLGLGALLRFAVRGLTLTQALDRLGAKTGATLAPVFLSDPRAAIDVDSIDDWRLVEQAVDAEAPVRAG